MDEMQSRIAARRAQIEREQRLQPGAEELAASEPPVIDNSRASGVAASGDKDRPDVAGPMQDRIAARRAEIERERARAEVQAKADAQARQAEKRAAADQAWAERARQKKARLDRELPDAPKRNDRVEAQRKKDAMDQLLREAIRRKWTGGEIGVVGLLTVSGILLFSSHPLVGTILMLLGLAAYFSLKSKYKEEVLKEFPDMFGDTVQPTKPPTSNG